MGVVGGCGGDGVMVGSVMYTAGDSHEENLAVGGFVSFGFVTLDIR